MNSNNEDQELLKFKKKKTKRTTFNLLKSASIALDNLSKKQGFKHKAIFGLLEYLYENKREDINNCIVKNSTMDIDENRVQRTLLVRDESLTMLKGLTKDHKLKRDLITSFLITYLDLLFESAEKKEKEGFMKGQKLYSPISDFLYKQEKILIKELGDDHPIVNEFGKLIVMSDNLSMAIYDHIDGTKEFEEDSIWGG